MDKEEGNILNLINKEINNLPIMNRQDELKNCSKTENSKIININIKRISNDKNNNSLIERKPYVSRRQKKCKVLNNITTLSKDELFKNNYSLKINNTDNDKENNIKKLNNAINNINIKLNSSINNINNIETIKINRKNKRSINFDYENKSHNNKKIRIFSRSFKKYQSSIDNNNINRKIYIYSDRNRPRLKTLTNNNTDTNQNINLNSYNNNTRPNKKRIFSSLKIKSKSKINDFSLSNNYYKFSKIKNKKRYNSVQHSSSKNECLKVNKKLDISTIGHINNYNNNSINIKKKSFSLKKSKNINNLKNNSFINSNCNSNNKKQRNILSPKEKIIELKIKELDNETLKFREERNKVNELKIEYEKLQAQLFKDIDDFVKKKEEFEKFKQNEINNINKERKNMLLDNKFILNVKNQSKLLELEVKKNEETIVQLKIQISELQLIIKNKDNEIKNLQKIINENNLNKNISSVKKIKEIKIGNDNTKIFSLINKKNNSVKFLNNTEKINDIYNAKTFKKINIIKNKNNGSRSNNISNNNSILGQKNSCRLFKKKYNKENNNINKDFFSSHVINNDSCISSSNISNRINNKSSLVFNPSLLKNSVYDSISYNNVNLRSESNNNMSINNSKIESIKSIKSTFIINSNNNTINNYQNKNESNKNKNNYINPIQCKLKKNLKNSCRLKNEIIRVNSNLVNTSYIKSETDTNNNYIIPKINENLEQNILKESTHNNSNDFVIPEKYIEIDKNNNNKIIKLLNINGNNIAIYSNNKKEITYPDGMRQIIYDDNHQIIYYNNGDMKQIFNNGKTVFYDCKEQKIETLYENGIKIVKYKNGGMERLLSDNKENLNNNNNIAELNVNFSSNNIEKNNDLKKRIEKKYIYNNKYKTILK